MSKNSNLDSWWNEEFRSNPAYIDAMYKEGVLIDHDTGKPLELEEGALLRIKVAEFSLPKKLQNHHEKIENVTLLEKESKLFFTIKLDGNNKEFGLIIRDNLLIIRKGNRMGRLSNVFCEVFDDNNNLVATANSLNEAYTRTSVFLNPENRTHTANAFRVFYYEGIRLKDIRPF